MKRRVLSLLLVLALCACLAPMAFAVAAEPVAESEAVEEVAAEIPAEEETAEEEPAEPVELTEAEQLPAEECTEEGETTNKSTLALSVVNVSTSQTYGAGDEIVLDAGDEIILKVSISNSGTEPAALQLTFDFDGFIVESATSPIEEKGAAIFSTNSEQLVTLTFDTEESEGTTTYTPAVLDGVLAEITLKAPRQTESETVSCTIKADVVEACDMDEDKVAFEADSVQRTITVNKANYIPGDVNNTGVVDIVDVLHLLKKVAGQDVVMAYEGDVNNDGTVDIVDVLHLLKYVAGQDVKIY